MISTSEKRALEKRIKALEQWKQETLDSVRDLIYSFSLIPGIFDGLEEGEEVKEILAKLRSKAFPFENVK